MTEIVTDSVPSYCPSLLFSNTPPTLNFSRLARRAFTVFPQSVVLPAPSKNAKSKEKEIKLETVAQENL